MVDSPNEIDDKLAYFQAITGLEDRSLCNQILEAHGWNLEVAISAITDGAISSSPNEASGSTNSAHFVSWGGNVRASEGFKMSNSLKASTFPFCAVVMAATNQRIALLQQVLVRFPNGERKERRFYSSATIQSLYDYVDSLNCLNAEKYSLVSNFP